MEQQNNDFEDGSEAIIFRSRFQIGGDGVEIETEGSIRHCGAWARRRQPDASAVREISDDAMMDARCRETATPVSSLSLLEVF